MAEYRRASWIDIIPVSIPIDPILGNSLDNGEASVIPLALQLRKDTILIDERKARKIARSVYGLKVVGSARILVDAKKKGCLDNVGNALTAMRENGYWIGDSIFDAALKYANEGRDKADGE